MIRCSSEPARSSAGEEFREVRVREGTYAKSVPLTVLFVALVVTMATISICVSTYRQERAPDRPLTAEERAVGCVSRPAPGTSFIVTVYEPGTGCLSEKIDGPLNLGSYPDAYSVPLHMKGTRGSLLVFSVSMPEEGYYPRLGGAGPGSRFLIVAAG